MIKPNQDLKVRQPLTKTMVSKNSHSHFKTKQRIYFIIFLLLVSLSLIILALSFHDPNPINNNKLSTSQRISQKDDHIPVAKHPEWLKIIEQKLRDKKKKIKLGLVNLDHDHHGLHDGLKGLDRVETVSVRFDRLTGDNKREWEEYFPEWIDEHHKWGPPRCPEIPLPTSLEQYNDLDVVVASVPCGTNYTRKGVRDVFRLQVNLVAANLAVRSGWENQGVVHRTVYVVFVGSCGPMLEIFRCDDLVKHRKGEYWVYWPEMRRLKQKVLMPVGSCQLAPGYAETGKERWQSLTLHSTNKTNHTTPRYRRPRYAYATVLHSLEAYVCGAIVLAQSIRRTNSTKDLVLLADTSSLSLSSLHALRSAGWDVLPIHRIHSPFAAKGAYNEWNYSKLRIFQLTEYDKIIFIDSDLVVLNNLDRLFIYPPLSAAANDKFMFNSGVMVIEPSLCLFETLMRLSFKLESYNGGDQGFLNEVFTWWHRLPKGINTLKIFRRYRNGKIENDRDHLIPEEVDAIHYLGLKPWMCYKDYDCNWDKADHRIFASDAAHRRWWEVYDGMPEELQAHCGLTRKMDARIKKWRGIARKEKLHGGRWKVKVKDPRQHHYIGGS